MDRWALAAGVVALVTCDVRAQAPFAWGVVLRDGGPYADLPVAAQVAAVKELGAGWVRVDAEDPAFVRRVVDAARAAGVRALPVLKPAVDVNGSSAPAAVYRACRDRGKAWGEALAGKVEFYEIGGKLDEACVRPRASGLEARDYDPAAYAACREAVRGIADGLREGDPACKRVVNGGWTRTGFVQKLLDDRVAFESISWRWDSAWGDITAAGARRVNVASRLSGLGKGPAWVTELVVSGRPTPEGEQARAGSVRRAAEALYLQPEVRGVFLSDLLESAQGTGLVGVLNQGGTSAIAGKKPAFEAYRRVIERTREKKY